MEGEGVRGRNQKRDWLTNAPVIVILAEFWHRFHLVLGGIQTHYIPIEPPLNLTTAFSSTKIVLFEDDSNDDAYKRWGLIE